MPRQHGTDEKTLYANFRELRLSGRSEDQAWAIAHKWQDEDLKKKKKK